MRRPCAHTAITAVPLSEEHTYAASYPPPPFLLSKLGTDVSDNRQRKGRRESRVRLMWPKGMILT